MNIVILGAGRLGSVMGGLLKKKNKVELWDKVAGFVKNQKPLEDIIPLADFVFLCVPSWVLREALRDISTLLKRGAIVVNFSKGIEGGTYLTADAIMTKELPKGIEFAFIGGPMMAEEIVHGLGGFGLCASSTKKTYITLHKLFHGSHIHLEYSNEVRSVVLSGVLKNIYSVGLGIASGLDWGGNSKGYLTVKIIEEMRSIMKDLKENPETILGLAGLGDIITTGFSKHSSNYKTGRAIVELGEIKQSEGTRSIASIIKMLGARAKKYEFLRILENVIIKKKKARSEFEAFRLKS